MFYIINGVILLWHKWNRILFSYLDNRYCQPYYLRLLRLFDLQWKAGNQFLANGEKSNIFLFVLARYLVLFVNYFAICLLSVICFIFLVSLVCLSFYPQSFCEKHTQISRHVHSLQIHSSSFSHCSWDWSDCIDRIISLEPEQNLWIRLLLQSIHSHLSCHRNVYCWIFSSTSLVRSL